jgi:flagellar motor switch protein FliG
VSAARHSIAGSRKAAILLVLLGDDAASAIYRNLADKEVQELTREIAELDYVSPDLAAHVLQEYNRLTLTQEYVAQGGLEYANKLLVKAFGNDVARSLLDQVERTQEARAGNLDSLQKADPQHLAKFLESEHPQTIALIIAHLEAKQASSLLRLLPDNLRADIVRRLAEMRQFSPEMAQRISVVLNKKLESLGQHRQRGYAGVKAVAELLNRFDPQESKSILEKIEADDPSLAVSIRNLMYTFEDLVTAPDVAIRELLAQVDKKTLAMALKNASDELKEHIFRCMSSRAVEMMKEDMDVLGPVRSREVGHSQQEIVSMARKLEQEGKFLLKPEQDDEIVV